MAELKTQKTEASVSAFLERVADPGRRADCRTVAKLMQKATGARPAMWGPSIVGFGKRTLRYATGRELEWFVMGFSPRKQDLTLYVLDGGAGEAALLRKLGRHKTGRSCLYLKCLADVDAKVLDRLIRRAAR